MGKYRILKWRLFAEERPTCSGLYICKIKNSIASVGLSYDKETNNWSDDFGQKYNVAWWAFFPRLPEERLDFAINPRARRYSLKLTAEEIIIFRENLSFILSNCNVPKCLVKSISSLHSYFENCL